MNLKLWEIQTIIIIMSDNKMFKKKENISKKKVNYFE